MSAKNLNQKSCDASPGQGNVKLLKKSLTRLGVPTFPEGIRTFPIAKLKMLNLIAKLLSKKDAHEALSSYLSIRFFHVYA